MLWIVSDSMSSPDRSRAFTFAARRQRVWLQRCCSGISPQQWPGSAVVEHELAHKGGATFREANLNGLCLAGAVLAGAHNGNSADPRNTA